MMSYKIFLSSFSICIFLLLVGCPGGLPAEDVSTCESALQCAENLLTPSSFAEQKEKFNPSDGSCWSAKGTPCAEQCDALRNQLRIEKPYASSCISSVDPPKTTAKQHWRLTLKDEPDVELRLVVQKQKDAMLIRCALFALRWTYKERRQTTVQTGAGPLSCVFKAEKTEAELTCNDTLEMKTTLVEPFDKTWDIGLVSLRFQGRFVSEQSITGTLFVEDRSANETQNFQWSFTGQPEFPVRAVIDDNSESFCTKCFGNGKCN